MKHLIFFLGLFSMTSFFNLPAQAQNACGGIIQFSGDCAANKRDYHTSCCPDGYRVQGVAYTDIGGKDVVDGVSVVCRHVSKGNDLIATNDFQREPIKMVCDNNEVLVGIYAKDTQGDQGKSDSLDGLTAICQKPGSDGLRRIGNSDISGGREGVETVSKLPRRVVGVAMKDKDKGGNSSSDEADCVTTITD